VRTSRLRRSTARCCDSADWLKPIIGCKSLTDFSPSASWHRIIRRDVFAIAPSMSLALWAFFSSRRRLLLVMRTAGTLSRVRRACRGLIFIGLGL
jgi:hypothetical protein